MRCSGELRLAALCVVLCACAGDQPAAPSTFSVRDSAGIEIVTSDRPLFDDSTSWTIDTEPRVSIGLEDGDPNYLFDRIAGAVGLPDGGIAILNSGSSELRFYDSTGRFIRSTGRDGEGPGEFRRPAHLVRTAGDSLMVWDAGLGGVGVFTSTGVLGRHTRVSPDSVMRVITMKKATEGLTPMPDGSFVLHVTHRGDPDKMGFPEGQLIRPPIGYYRFQRDFSRVDSLGWYGGLTQMYLRIGGRAVYETVPFPAHAQLTGGGAPLRVYAGNGDPYEIHMYDDSGRMRRIIRNTSPPVAIPPEVMAKRRHVEDSTAKMSEFMASWIRDTRKVEEAIPPQTHWPAYRRFTLDSEGCLWVETFGDGVHVYDPEGRWVARSKVPGLIMDVGRDYVLVKQRDDMSIERVILYALQRPAAPPAVSAR